MATAAERRNAVEMKTAERRAAREQKIQAIEQRLEELRRKQREDDPQVRVKKLKADAHRKTVLGGSILAAIRCGRLSKDQVRAAIEPALRDHDRKVVDELFASLTDG